MVQNIQLFKKYVPMLDEVLALSTLTSDLDGANELVREGANANELLIPKMDMDGLGAYDRVKGYTPGGVSFTYETKKCNFDRSRKFSVDALDNQETQNMAFGKLAGQFVRTKVGPELDAFRISKYASADGVTKVEGSLANGKAVLAALTKASTAMDEAEVPYENRILYITPTLMGMIDDVALTDSRKALDRFAKVVKVPQTRMYTEITQKAGAEDDGGYEKAPSGKDINFMIVQKEAVIQFQKHTVPRTFTPDQNQDADAYIYTYRNVGIAEVYDNKVKGVYVHHVGA